ncbi:MAG: amidohydrolase family protein [Acidimicrobiia bacterium]
MPDTAAKVIDIHHHVGAAPAISAGTLTDEEIRRAEDQDLATRLAFMDANGIDQAVLLPGSGGGTPNGFADRCDRNTRVAAYRDREPTRFAAALGSVSPSDGDLALDEIERCFGELGMAGLVWHHRFDGVTIDHGQMDAFLSRLATHGKPAFVHILADSTLEAPWRLEILADRFPEVQFLALDAFSSVTQSHWMPYLASKHPNIAFDTAMMVSCGHFIDDFVAKIGAERLCFGTDFYSSPRLFGVPLPLVETRALGFTRAQEDAILGGNAQRILGLA